VTITTFDPAGELIIVNVLVSNAQGKIADVRFALNTGSSATLVLPEVTDDLGYSARDGDAITVIRSPIGNERGYMMRVASFSALGFTIPDFRIHVHDLPEGYGIEGVLGLSFLKQFNYEVRSREGRILVERIAPAAV